MVKIIKFPLELNGKQIRDLEALKANFEIEAILKYFQDGRLEKWLRIRDFAELSEQIKMIDKSANKQKIIKEIANIIGYEIDENSIEKYFQEKIEKRLELDGKQIKDLDELRKNKLDSILKYFKDGLLEEWLKVNGYPELAERIKMIDKSTNNHKIMKEISKVIKY